MNYDVRMQLLVYFIVVNVLGLALLSRAILYEEPQGSQAWGRFQHITKGVNKTKLIRQYSSVCPVYGSQCDSQYEDYPFILHNSTETFYPCMTCSCRERCILYGSCCPSDVRGYLSYQCVNTQTYPKTNSSVAFLMVSTCNNESDIHFKSNCEKPVDDVPVTSRLTAVTYRNQYCALCNNDTDFEPWELSVECTTQFDVSSLGSMADIKQALRQHSCRVAYESVPPSLGVSCNLGAGKAKSVDRCNVTGLWKRFDPDINWACQNLVSDFRGFKNVYCYICNPSLASSLQTYHISECNVTGEWEEYDPEMETGCLTQPASDRFGPFKNTYCFLCNGGTGKLDYHSHMRWQVDSFLVTTTEDGLLLGEPGGITVSLSRTANTDSIDDIKAVLADIATGYTDEFEMDGGDKDFAVLRPYIGSLLHDHQSVCGDSIPCVLDSDNDTTTTHPDFYFCSFCSCASSCAENFNCCPDVLLQKRPYTCLQETGRGGLSSSTADRRPAGKLVISKCLTNSAPDRLKQGCESDQDVYSRIPVVSSYGKVPFRNIYCWACNNYFGEATIEVKMQVTCKTYVDATLFVDLRGMLQFFAAHCRIRFDVPEYGSCRYDDKPEMSEPPSSSGTAVSTLGPGPVKYFDRCNMTGLWFVQPTDDISYIATACQSNAMSGFSDLQISENKYRNVFCFICNPREPYSNILIDSCNVTGNMTFYDTSLDDQCASHSEYPRWRPYKNLYCMNCNVDVVPKMPDIEWSMASEYGSSERPYYRKILSLDPNTWRMYEDQTEPHPNCTNGTYDLTLKSCRELYCPEGRILRDGACVTFIQKVNDLQYSLSVVWRVAGLSSQTSDWFYLEDVCQTVMSNLTERNANDSMVQFNQCNLHANEPCIYNSHNDKGVLAKQGSQIALSLEITVSTDKRNLLEHSLVNATESGLSIKTVGNGTIWFEKCRPFPDTKDVMKRDCGNFGHVPKDECSYSHIPPILRYLNDIDQLPPKTFNIRKLLVCPQVKLETGEYVYDNDTDEIVLVKSGRKLRNTEYISAENLSVLVCQEDYIQAKNQDEDSEEQSTIATVHGLFSLCCTIISLVCLFLTFVTYSVFPALRTLPGKNNMSLVTCLFCAQASLQFGLYHPDPALCVFLGMFIHFSWMASFCAMNVCSFHMFRVFCSRSLSLPSADLDFKVFVRYILYILGFPALAVAVIAIVFLAKSDGHDTGYGQLACFISNYFAAAFGFIAPAIVLFISNIVFFVITFHKIRTSPSVQNTAGDRRELSLYVKLCTLTGISWPLMIIDATLDVSIFSFFATLVNALQGLFIFVSYVCNRRVFNLYKKKMPKSPRGDSLMSSKQTNSTQLTDLTLGNKNK